jgi:hypothetical protein
MKTPSSVSKLLTNRYVLYFVSLLALFNVLGYVMLGNTQIVILFLLIGFLMSRFSKNMVIVLLVPLVLVNVLTSGMVMKEGFAEGNEGAPPVEAVPTTKDECDKLPDKYSWNDSDKKCVPTDGFAGAGAKKGSSRIDMGTTLEQAYDDLNNVLGSDGIKSLTNDTQNLMKQQLHLAEAMKEMGPLMQQAQGMLKTLNIDGLGDLPSLIKKFGVGANPIAAAVKA